MSIAINSGPNIKHLKKLLSESCDSYIEENGVLPKTFDDITPYFDVPSDVREKYLYDFNNNLSNRLFYIIENRIEVRSLYEGKGYVFIYFMDTTQRKYITLKNVTSMSELEEYSYGSKGKS